jgi:hypothetical protein
MEKFLLCYGGWQELHLDRYRTETHRFELVWLRLKLEVKLIAKAHGRFGTQAMWTPG